MTKTVSTKLSKEDFEKFQERCNNNGQNMCESLRDLIKMNPKSNSNPYEHCDFCDEEVHDTLRKVANSLHDSENYEVTEDDDGRIIKFTTHWYYD